METSRLIFIVDDETDYLFLLQALFARFYPTYTVRFFTSGKALLNELHRLSEQPDLILLDRHMPEPDGHQTLLALKQHPAFQLIPVVMMSAQATTEEINGCYQAGVNSFLLKSLDIHSLKQNLTVLCQYWLELNLVARYM
ncbi:response regulator [Spirosoma sp. KCTC 42546]|uniref:response regulator n=1 Tax=Spirosoma sp. KCTC 42546 TaxID=2520506 RepID=UPI0011582C87|nr:response regulator [Spirosoma sp. KCTC 42546]QDK81620.1 response regulator [Spirosoma sp. KCTC 42546]